MLTVLRKETKSSGMVFKNRTPLSSLGTVYTDEKALQPAVARNVSTLQSLYIALCPHASAIPDILQVLVLPIAFNAWDQVFSSELVELLSSTMIFPQCWWGSHNGCICPSSAGSPKSLRITASGSTVMWGECTWINKGAGTVNCLGSRARLSLSPTYAFPGKRYHLCGRCHS